METITIEQLSQSIQLHDGKPLFDIEQFLASIASVDSLQQHFLSVLCSDKCPIDVKQKFFHRWNWELFDKAFLLTSTATASGSSTAHQQLLQLVLHVSQHVRAKEILMMAIEKLPSSSSLSSLQLVLFTVQCALVCILRENGTQKKLSVVQHGLTAILRRLVAVVQQSASEEEALQQQQQEALNADDKVTDISDFVTADDIRRDIINLGLCFLHGVFSKALKWLDSLVVELSTSKAVSMDEKHFMDQLHGLFIGFLLSLTGRCIPSLVDHRRMNSMLQKASILLNHISGGNMVTIFQHIYRQRYRIHLHEKRDAAHKYRQAYCSKRFQSQQNNMQQLTEEDSVAVLNRISCSKYNKGLIDYIEWVNAITVGNQSEAHHSELVPWKLVTDKRIKQLNSAAGTTTETIDSISIETYSKMMPFDVEVQVSTKLPWNLTGIALIAYYYYLAAAKNPTADGVDAEEAETSFTLNFPCVHNMHWLGQLLSVYLPLLFGHRRLANAEALLLAIEVVTASDVQAIANTEHKLLQPIIAMCPIFSQYLTDVEIKDAYAHLLLAANRSLPTSSDSTGKEIHWRLVDALHLSHVASSSIDILSFCQQMINGMANCADAELRSKAYRVLRSYLQCSVDDRSLFGLLQVLSESCPFSNIKGLLVDMVKDRCQHAALQAAKSLASLNWLHESKGSGGQKKFPLQQLFKSSEVLITKSSLSDEEVQCMILEEDTEASSSFEDGESVDNTFISLDLCTSRVRASIAQEMYPAAPYILPGLSPFWSPLLLERFVHMPLSDFIHKHEQNESEIVIEIINNLDALASYINLLQFIALRIQASFITEADSTIINRYFEGSLMLSTGDTDKLTISACQEWFQNELPRNRCNATAMYYQPPMSTFMYNKLKAIRCIFELREIVQRLHKMVSQVMHEQEAASGSEEETYIRISLLSSNIDYALIHWSKLCTYIFNTILSYSK